jgi:flagellar motility protein MotE (MotC chaperone)
VFSDFRSFNETNYSGFSTLLRTTFDDARPYFADGSIDLLHIDGMHSYESVRHDFETWRSALSERGVVVFHDTGVRERDFGVWKLWQELTRQYPSFEFFDSNGLGILGVGVDQPPALRQLYAIAPHSRDAAILRRVFSLRGETYRWRVRAVEYSSQIEALTSEKRTLGAELVQEQRASREALEASDHDRQHLHEALDQLRLDHSQLREAMEHLRGAHRGEVAALTRERDSLNGALSQSETALDDIRKGLQASDVALRNANLQILSLQSERQKLKQTTGEQADTIRNLHARLMDKDVEAGRLGDTIEGLQDESARRIKRIQSEA